MQWKKHNNPILCDMIKGDLNASNHPLRNNYWFSKILHSKEVKAATSVWPGAVSKVNHSET